MRPGGRGGRERPNAPLAAQIMALLLGGLVIAQLATLLLTLLWPPAAPAQYRLEDIAAALGGRRVPSRGARPLVRTVRDAPPSLRSAGWLVSERSRHDLARLVGADERDVRLLFYSPLPFAGAGGGGLADGGGQGRGRGIDFAAAEPASGYALTRVAFAPEGGPPGGFGPHGPGAGGFGGFGHGAGQGGVGALDHQRDDAGSAGTPGRHGQGRAGQRGGAGLGGAGGRGGAAGRPGGEAAIPSAPTTLDPPGSHAASGFLSLREVAPAGRLGDLVRRPEGGEARGAAGHAAAVPPMAAIRAPVLAGAAAGAFPPELFPSPAPESPRGASSREAPTRPAPSIRAPEPHVIAPAPVIPVAPPPVVALAPAPTAVAPEVLADGVADLGVIAPAPLVAARSGDTGGYVVRAPEAQRRGLFGLAAAPFVQGDFVAAVRVGPGRWITVQPRPEPFPNSWQRRVLLWFALAFALVAPLGWLFARRLARPLRDFAAAAERLGRDPSGEAAPLSGPAEIGRAARAFNAMQARLKRFVEDRTAMVGAISHDLRTPLARMRFRMERAPPELKAGMLHDIGQMEEMISSVLVFIRDASEPSVRERVDLRSIVECVVDDAALVGGAAVLDPGGPMSVEVDPLSVQRVLSNLVDNALKYGSRAQVRMYADGEEAVAEVVDDGPGLPPEELERVFLPFYRSAGARTLNSGGIGLGLAVSRSIARAHGGDVRLLAAGGRGVRAQLRLPLALKAA